MKRSLAWLLAVVMLLGLTGCGGYEGPNIVGSYRNREGLCLQVHEDGTWDVGGTILSGTWEYGSGGEIYIKDNRGSEYSVFQYTTVEKPFLIEGLAWEFYKETNDPNIDNTQVVDAEALFGCWYVIEEGVSREHYPGGDELYFDEGTLYSNGSLATVYEVQDNQLTISSTSTFMDEDKKFAKGYTYEITLVNGVLTLQYPGNAPLRFADTEDYNPNDSYYGNVLEPEQNDELVGTWKVIEEGVSRGPYPESDILVFNNDGSFVSGTTRGYYTVNGSLLTMGGDKLASDYCYDYIITRDVLSIQYQNATPLRFERVN